jgi:hypothetical protein
MRNMVVLLLAVGLVVASGCGEVQKLAVDAPPPGDDAAGDALVDAPAACATYNGVWETNEISFDTAIAPTSRVDFETRGDGVTGVIAGTPVPRDEYLACCGIRLEYVGPAGGSLIWAGNAQGGFEVRGSCPMAPNCLDISGVRVTFVPAVTAAGVEYPGGTTGTMFDAQNNVISKMTVQGSGTNFLGYKSAVRIDHIEYVDNAAEDLEKLLYHRCQ